MIYNYIRRVKLSLLSFRVKYPFLYFLVFYAIENNCQTQNIFALSKKLI